MSKKVVRVLFHDVNVVIPGIGTFAGELPSRAKTVPGLSMIEGTNGIEISAGNVSAVIPFANCKIWFLDTSVETKTPAKK